MLHLKICCYVGRMNSACLDCAFPLLLGGIQKLHIWFSKPTNTSEAVQNLSSSHLEHFWPEINVWIFSVAITSLSISKFICVVTWQVIQVQVSHSVIPIVVHQNLVSCVRIQAQSGPECQHLFLFNSSAHAAPAKYHIFTLSYKRCAKG